MDNGTTNIFEQPLVSLVNDYLDDTDMYFYEGEYFKLSFNVYSEFKLKLILDAFKFKKKGYASDYPDIMPTQDSFNDSDAYVNYKKSNIISISKKYKAVMIYTVYRYSIKIFCILDNRKYKKFNSKLTEILNTYDGSGLFTNFNFKCKKLEFIEISDSKNNEDERISIQKKTIEDESLVFISNSTIYTVMNDITLFFKEDTKDLYNKMKISYKRGIILYGNPGNGKTAMIREIIRKLKGVSIINISPSTQRVPFIITEIINALNKQPAIIVLEDVDALLNNYNRSEFLNVLDGINMKSGVYFIGTTNYPERIDPAFVNRSGRFDRMFEIGNPNEDIRKEFFINANIDEILLDYKIYKQNSNNKDLSIIELFVKYSDDLSMANLKELMISTKYMLISDNTKSIEECLEVTYNNLKNVKKTHDESFNNYREYKKRIPNNDNDEF